jgi:hypothetical protein
MGISWDVLTPETITNWFLYGVPDTPEFYSDRIRDADQPGSTSVSLEAFIHEYRLTMPIGVDQAGDGTPIPLTMQRYGMRGTPTTIIIDRTRHIRHHGFGQDDDLALGLRLGALLAEQAIKAASELGAICAQGACSAPGATT